ncbi:MAG: NAD(+)/NADH kinase [Butyrivibrio sp.]|uniref:NAD(+)/NADH kinase n=1 Tax=Butyrivibrio sp. TaxID=28121 RepID=UPI0025F5C77C|nr:NAD(+)/NADH kinase [Butyrivibrio sp.]MCR5773431.1 NAD(+)/NADH kinase [Butyrivibrio sp.]
MDHFLIFTNKSKDKNLEFTNKVTDFLESHGKKCYIAHFEEPGNNTLRPDAVMFRTQVPPEIECCIVLGGDGTMLQAAVNVRERNIPILGINLGTMGYLTEIDRNHINEALQRLINDDYVIEERMLLSGTKVTGERKEFIALNDIVIARKAAVQIIKLVVYVDDRLLTTYLADGVIISTPTGSTGYNMSAGGPLVSPQSNTMVITPICPHSLTNRSIVLPASDKITIELGAGKADRIQEAEASVDGHFGASISTGDRIEIRKAAKISKILRMNQVSFVEILNQKLL